MALKFRGHEVWTESRDRRDEFPDSHVKWWAMCSCGYRSTWRGSETIAAGAAYHHLWKVVGGSTTQQEFMDTLRARHLSSPQR